MSVLPFRMLKLAMPLQAPPSLARPLLPPPPLPPRYVVIPGPPAQSSFQATLEGLAAVQQVGSLLPINCISMRRMCRHASCEISTSFRKFHTRLLRMV